MITASTPPLERAIALVGVGLSVIPVPAPRPGAVPGEPGDGKVPGVAWREYQSRRPTLDELRAWFSGPPMNLAVVTGAVSGIVVVDADTAGALTWWTTHRPYSPWQVRTARGWHVYYRHPGERVPNRARLQTPDGRLALDVRGDGGYVIGPGSTHHSGAVYEPGGNWRTPRSELPLFSPKWLEPPTVATPAPRPLGPRPTGDRVERARRYLAKIDRPEIGHGSDAAVLYAACRLARGFDLSPSDAESLIWEWAGGRPGWTRAWVARKVEHALRYGTEPVGAKL